MKYRNLGNTSIKVSEIGFGTWGLGSSKGGDISYGDIDESKSIFLIKYAIEHGINYFDTSDLYGFGYSEKILGISLEGERENVVLATKSGYTNKSGEQNFSKKYIETSIFNSLNRLKTDYIDVFQLHDPYPHDLEDNMETLSFLSNCKDKGLINAIGASVRKPSDVHDLLKLFPFDMFQINYNLIDRRAEDSGVLEKCKRNGIGVVVRTPLAFGFLSGTIPLGKKFPLNDHRSRWSNEQRLLWVQSVDKFRDLIAMHKGITPSQYALRFCLSNDSVSCTIPGMMNTSEIDENIETIKYPLLSEYEEAKLREIYNNNVFFVKG